MCIRDRLKTAQECDINGLGPQISPGELELLCRKLDTLKQDDILVLAGSLPPSLPENCYEDILARLEGRGIQFVVDTEGIWLLNTLKHRPFLVKPNHHELGGLFGTEPQNTAEIIRMAKELQARGARNVLVSLAKDGAVLIPEKGDVQIADAPDVYKRQAVGTPPGDARNGKNGGIKLQRQVEHVVYKAAVKVYVCADAFVNMPFFSNYLRRKPFDHGIQLEFLGQPLLFGKAQMCIRDSH